MTFHGDIIRDILDGAPRYGYSVVEQSNWTHNSGDTETRETIFSFNGKFYLISESRSGSPYTEWWYESNDWVDVSCNEVRRIEVKAYKWVGIDKV